MVSACGFQLRGTVNIASDLESLAVQGADREFQRTLTRNLEQTGITISDSAPYKVNILSLGRRELVASASGGNIVTDYEVIATLKWQLEEETGLVLIPEKELTQRGTYQRRSGEYNASQSELDTVWTELQRTLAANLTRKLASMTDADIQELVKKARDHQAAAEAAQTNSVNRL